MPTTLPYSNTVKGDFLPTKGPTLTVVVQYWELPGKVPHRHSLPIKTSNVTIDTITCRIGGLEEELCQQHLNQSHLLKGASEGPTWVPIPHLPGKQGSAVWSKSTRRVTPGKLLTGTPQ